MVATDLGRGSVNQGLLWLLLGLAQLEAPRYTPASHSWLPFLVGTGSLPLCLQAQHWEQLPSELLPELFRPFLASLILPAPLQRVPSIIFSLTLWAAIHLLHTKGQVAYCFTSSNHTTAACLPTPSASEITKNFHQGSESGRINFKSLFYFLQEFNHLPKITQLIIVCFIVCYMGITSTPHRTIVRIKWNNNVCNLDRFVKKTIQDAQLNVNFRSTMLLVCLCNIWDILVLKHHLSDIHM